MKKHTYVISGLTALALSIVPGLRAPAQTQPAHPSAPESAIEQLVEQALAHNPGLAAQRKRVEAAEQRPSQAAAFPDATADLEFMGISVDHPDLSNALTQGVSLGVTQILPYPGKRKLRKERARQEVEVARAELVSLQSDLRGEVIAAAYRYALLSRLLTINDQTKDALTAAAASAAGVYAAGSGSQADVLLAQTALTKNRTERKDLEQQIEITAARLTDLLGGSLDRPLLDRVVLPEPEALPELSALTERIDELAPRIRAAQSQVSVDEKSVELAKKDFRPDFMVGGRYRHHDMTMDGKDWVTAMVGISLPFFHYKSRYEPALQEATLRREGARQETDDVRNDVLYRVSDAYQSALRDDQVYDLYKNGLLIQARQAYEASVASYSVGKSDFTTLLSALTNLYTYQGQADMAKADFQASVARIQALLGSDTLPPAAPARQEGASDPLTGEKEKGS